MTPEQAAGAARPTVLKLGSAFIECPRTLRRARQMGISGWAFLVTGRGAVLGDVRTETVAAAIGILSPDAVADGWETAVRVATPSAVAEVSRAECCRWGIDYLAGFPPLARLIELVEPVVVAADATGMPLFAAWRGMPVPADAAPAARAAVLLHLLFEYYSGASLMAVRAAGMTAMEVILAGPEGESGAVTYGWSPPYPPVGPLVRRRLWAESVTDRIVAQAYGVLDPAERVELVSLLGAALTGVRMSPPNLD
ncbi:MULTISPECIES: SCO6745 family protein [unclassified Plantactinospora]|uniref:SCO6745 family protein n=1 Tax=unclassified Plantactinospora TaxID=2631981 RepID=UPI0031FD6E28